MLLKLQKISDKDNIYSIGFLLYISDIPSCDQRNPNNCRILFENATDTAALIGTRCNQSLKVVGLFHPHLHTFSTEPTSRGRSFDASNSTLNQGYILKIIMEYKCSSLLYYYFE